MTITWASVKVTREPEQTKTDLGNEGDILNVLRRVYDKYVAHAVHLFTKVEMQKRELTEAEQRGVD